MLPRKFWYSGIKRMVIIAMVINGIACFGEVVLFDESIANWSGNGKLLSSQYKVTGNYSLEWTYLGSSNSYLSISNPYLPEDLTSFGALSFWMYSPSVSNAKFNIIFYTNTGGYFCRTEIPIDWSGWKQIELPLDSFNKVSSNDSWENITEMRIYNYGWGISPTAGAEAYFDDIKFNNNNKDEIVILDEDFSSWTNLTSSTNFIKRGQFSAYWDNFGTSNSIIRINNSFMPSDWCSFDSISFWMYSPSISNAKFNISVQTDPSFAYFCRTGIPIDWSGWKRIELPLDSFTNCYGASWDKVTEIVFRNYGWGVAPTPGAEVYLDDIRLNYSYKMLLDDDISSWIYTSRETDSALVWKGMASAKLDDFGTEDRYYSASYPTIPIDWSQHDVFSFRMYSPSASNAQFNVVVKTGSSSAYFCRYGLTIDWSGWRRFELPLDSFTNCYGASWDEVTELRFYNYGWGASPTAGAEAYLDDVELYKKSIYSWLDWDAIITDAAQSNDPNFDFNAVLAAGANCQVVTRPTTLATITSRYISSRVANFPDGHPNKEIFALAMSDTYITAVLQSTMVDAAIRAKHLNDQDAIDYVINQLSEIVGYNSSNPAWHPLQRSGWEKYDPADTSPVPPEGDGIWLATGYGIFAIINTLDIMDTLIPDGLRQECITFLKEEITEIEKSWNKKITWFFPEHPQSNQWIIPMSGLMSAILFTERGDSSKILAIDSLRDSIEALGQDGSYGEGYAYNKAATPLLYFASWRLRESVGIDFLKSDYLQKNGDWVISHLMPGYHLLNASDCPTNFYDFMASSLALSAITTGKPEYYWAGDNVFLYKYPKHNMTKLLYHYYKQTSTTEPELYSYFPERNMVSWRTSWDNSSAIGIWIKGSSFEDSHSDEDRGHFSLYDGTTPILIEAGTPSYADLDGKSMFNNAAGHNVLQAPAHYDAEICELTVNSLDANGGSVVIDGTPAYTGVINWQRSITFSSISVSVSDVISLDADKTSSDEWLRFHTGSTSQVTISGSGQNWTAAWSGYTMTFTADRDIVVSQIQWDNCTLQSTKTQHYCIVVKTANSETNLNLTTTVSGF